MKAYYEDEFVKLYHGDCRAVLPMLDVPGVGDVLIFDPPYGISHKSTYDASWDGNVIANDDSLVVRDWIFDHFKGVPGFAFGTWKQSRPDCRAVLIWDKGPAFGMGDLSFPWKNSFEEIYVFGDGFSGRRDEGVIRGHIVPSWESHGHRHQHEKPLTLMSYLLGKCPQARRVIDPCCGTGPTLQAAKLAGIAAIGIEVEERYCAVAAERLRQGVLFGC